MPLALRTAAVDDVQDQTVCLVYPSEGLEGGVDAATRNAPVCGPTAPDVAPIDAGKAKMVDGRAPADAGIADANDGG